MITVRTKTTTTHEIKLTIGDGYKQVRSIKLRNGKPFGASKTTQYPTAKDALYAYLDAK